MAFQLPFRRSRRDSARSGSRWPHSGAAALAEAEDDSAPVPAPVDHTDWHQDIQGLEVVHAEFVAVTADDAEHAAHEAVLPILRRVRHALGLDIVFVAELLHQVPVVRQVAKGAAPARAAPGEVEHGALVLALRGDGDLSRQDYLACPVVAASGRSFGSVCCRPLPGGSGGDAREALHSVARMIALVLDRAPASPLPEVWDSSAATPLGLG